MAIKGLSLVEDEAFYSSFDDAPEDQKTKWIVGAIDLMVRSYIQDNTISWVQQAEGGMQMINRTASRDFEVCRFGLKGFENFKDDKGGDIKYNTVDRALFNKVYKVVDDAVLNKVPGPVIAELAAHIIEINTATDELRKK